jgi:hypothetical protein
MKGIDTMKSLYHLMAMLFMFMLIGNPAAAQTPLDQNTPVVSQNPQTEEEDTAAVTAPELYIPDKIHQFDNVPAGRTVTHDYIVHNKGTATLRITRVKTG